MVSHGSWAALLAGRRIVVFWPFGYNPTVPLSEFQNCSKLNARAARAKGQPQTPTLGGTSSSTFRNIQKKLDGVERFLLIAILALSRTALQPAGKLGPRAFLSWKYTNSGIQLRGHIRLLELMQTESKS